MTVRILIVHADPEKGRNIRVRETSGTGGPDRCHTILKPGESTEVVVHDLARVIVEQEPLP
jgi:hypothetical protein